ncbi:Beta-glucan synthesis-associated protein KRE6 [Nakaseomyces bracarensis]|uniref:Beta-glucan synthesis-associated protein KRE6 n=1 Tax=Nakaseomyces bracarensis TaxID=273131 RepID=A0ABR4NPF3_9SACH
MSFRDLTGNGRSSDESVSTASLEPRHEKYLNNPFVGDDEVTSSAELLPVGTERERRGMPDLDSDEIEIVPEHVHSSSDSNSLSLNEKLASDYRGYYKQPQKGSPSRFYSASRKGSYSPMNAGNNSELSSNDIRAPPAFDRYPLVGSRLHLSNYRQAFSKNDSPPPPLKNEKLSSTGEYSTMLPSSVMFLEDQDFSPFGGYPATAFPLSLDEKEDDDFLHNPDPEEEARLDRKRFSEDFKHMSKQSFGGFLGILFLFLGAIALFIILPVLTYSGAVDHHDRNVPAATNTTNSTHQTSVPLSLYQYPQLSAIRTSLVDSDTPSSAQTRKAKDGSTWKLVFSDEFNAVGRTFYDGDDQFWTAPDIHYDATKDLEWYSPDAVTTNNGTLQLRMDAFKNHNLYYRSGMVQSWNKMCFTQGALEISANLPNYGKVTGLWPGLWTMGNLGRPGYLASTEGVWPYSYSSCDAGITPNQSAPDGISYLPGQKLSACTCDGEDHPNPGVGRGAPELDILEAEASTILGVGVASQSMQIAPFDIWYMPDYEFIEIYNFSTTSMNSYCGGPFQQAISAVTTLNVSWYEFGEGSGKFQKYVIEYLNDEEEGYVKWYVGDDPTFTIYSTALHPNGNIDWRYISKEPMSMIMNMGISPNWAYIDWQMIYFPVVMSIDYVRLYQPSDAISLTCDPEDYPTYDYIEAHKNAYYNMNLTSWEMAGYTYPKNQLTGNCKSSKFKG